MYWRRLQILLKLILNNEDYEVLDTYDQTEPNLKQKGYISHRILLMNLIW